MANTRTSITSSKCALCEHAQCVILIILPTRPSGEVLISFLSLEPLLLQTLSGLAMSDYSNGEMNGTLIIKPEDVDMVSSSTMKSCVLVKYITSNAFT